MNNVLLKNDSGESAVASVVRYFKYANQDYMLYTLNEVDASNYIKLYGITVSMDQLGNFIATAIDDSIWGNIVPLIKEMVKPISERTNNDFIDLNSNSISTINLLSKRVFKINKDMANLLIANVNIQNEVDNTLTDNAIQNQDTLETNDQNQIALETSGQNENNIQNTQTDLQDYKSLYEQEHNKNLELTSEIEAMRLKLQSIENILKG